jgi:hypothetical protein
MKKSNKIISAKPLAPLKQHRICFAGDDGLLESLDRAARVTKVTRSWLARTVLQGWLSEIRIEP